MLRVKGGGVAVKVSQELRLFSLTKECKRTDLGVLEE